MMSTANTGENSSNQNGLNVINQDGISKERKAMESLVYTANQVAELFQISLTAVYDLRNKGKLKQLPNVSGVRFSKKEVEALAGVESEYSAIGYKKLKNEVERLEKENNRLKSEIKKITSQMLVIVGEEL